MVSRKYNRKKRKISRRIQRNKRKLVSLKRNKRGGAVDGLSKNYTYGPSIIFNGFEYEFRRNYEYMINLLKKPNGADVTGLESNLTDNSEFTFVEKTQVEAGKEVTQYLGSGNFGNVVSAKMTKDGDTVDVAVKQINLKNDLEKNIKAAKDLLEEYKIHYKLQSNPMLNHVTKLFGVIDPDKVGIKVIMENCPGVGLDEYFLSQTTQLGKQNKDKEVLHQIYKYIQQIAKALEYISQENIVHRDISLKNILLCGEAQPYKAKLSDFGLARTVSLEGDAKFYFKQTPEGHLAMSLYSPDALREPELKFGFENDVWSFGLLMYGLLFLNTHIKDTIVGKATKYSQEEWYMKTHINRVFNEEEKKELFGIGFIGKHLKPKEVLNKLNLPNPENNPDPENLEDLKANHFYQTIIKGCFYEPQEIVLNRNQVSGSSELKQRFNIKTISEKISEFIENYVDGVVDANKLLQLYTSESYTNKDKEDFEKLFPIESHYLDVLFYGCRCAEGDRYMDVSEVNEADIGYLDVSSKAN